MMSCGWFDYFKREQFSPIAASGLLLQMGSWKEPEAQGGGGGREVAYLKDSLSEGGLRAQPRANSRGR